MTLRAQFDELLRQASLELFAANPTTMSTGALLPTPNVIAETDLELFFAALERGLVSVFAGGRFNTVDRPKSGGRWSLLSRSAAGGWYNAEYLPQIAAYADAVLNLGYPPARVLFELPATALQLDLAVLDDDGSVVVLGEAKRDNAMLAKLRTDCMTRFAKAAPTADTKKRGDEARQLAWRLWSVAAPYTWLIGPGQRRAYRTNLNPLTLTELESLPSANDLDLDHDPPVPLPPPVLA